MDFDVMKRAVDIAERDSEEFPEDDRSPVEIAEAELISYYDKRTIQFQLTRLKQIDAFTPRVALTYKALEDYEAERYYASILVILSIMDGLVLQVWSDTNEGANKGLWVNQADLEAWDSVAAYSNGLKKLVGDDLLHQGRGKTVVADIDMPYRHGIMHGQDLGYDNKVVAAKTWATLFAVGEWALKAENDELNEPTKEHAETPSKILFELLTQIREATKQHREAQETKRRVGEWEPRDQMVGKELPITRNPDDYEVGTPEKALVTFLSKWQDNNYGHMTDFLRDGPVEIDPGFVRSQFEHTQLVSFSLLDVTDTTPVKTEVSVELELDRFGSEESAVATVNLVRLGADIAETAFRDEPGVWVITDWRKLLVAQAN